jgi:hypothetical protein
MTRFVPATLIAELEAALKDTVPEKRYNDVITALKRCQELIGNLAATVADLDKQHMHGDLMFEAKLYANVLDGFFGEKDMSITQWMDIGKGYNPYAHLTDKGVLKTTPSAAEKRLADLKLDFPQQDIDELDQLIADIDRAMAPIPLKSPLVRAPRVGVKMHPRVKKINPSEMDAETAAFAKATGGTVYRRVGSVAVPTAKPRRGRPVGSKNKPKTGIVSKVNAILKANKKGASK